MANVQQYETPVGERIDLHSELSSLQGQIAAIAQKVETQSAVQLELVNLLKNLLSHQRGLPERLANVSNERQDRDLTMLRQVVSTELVNVLGEGMKYIIGGIGDIKQTANLTLREIGPPEQKIRVVFIVHSIPMWDAIGDVYLAMRDDDRFEPLVISVNTNFHGSGTIAGEDGVHAGLCEMGIAHLRFNLPRTEVLDVLRSLRPDIIFRQQQWDGPMPPGLQTMDLTFSRICVVPYGMGVLASRETSAANDAYDNNYDQAYHRQAWRVFCETEQTRTYYRSFDHSDPEKFILSGYPKLNRLLEAKGKGEWPIPEPDGRSFRVIWAPHHSVANSGSRFGVFEKIYLQMLDWAKQNPEIQFVLKPHPSLSNSLRQTKAISPQEYERFKTAWDSLPNCCTRVGTYGELFEASDVMLTDGVSFLSEYHLFEKPLIFFDSQKHGAFNALGRLAERAAHKVHTFEEMKAATLEYRAGKEWPLREERQELLQALLPCDVPPSRIILDTIANDIRNGR